MVKKPVFSLILPCYNEGSIMTDNVRRIKAALERLNYPYEILFVDDASRDHTQIHIRRLCKEIREASAMFHDINQGRGAAVMDGIMKARGSIVGYMDIDCEVSPVYIPEIVDIIIRHQADVVIGRRIYRSSFSSLVREIISVGYRWIASNILETQGIDTESGYKFFRKKKILPVLAATSDRHWFWDTEVVVFAIRRHLRIMEVPVLFLRRLDKKSSVRVLHDVIDYLVSLWRLRIRLAGNPSL
jgi:glycosyltransferase AglD